MALKLLHEPNKAIKSPFKFLIGGIFIFLGLMSGGWVVASTILITGFEPPTYSVGLLVDQDDWFIYEGADKVQVIDTDQVERLQSIYFPVHSASYWVAKTGTSTSVGSMGFWFKVKNSDGIKDNIFEFRVRNLATGKMVIRVGLGDVNRRVFYFSNGTYQILDNYSDDEWLSLDFEWDQESKQRLNFNGAGWTDWIINADNTTDVPDQIVLGFSNFGEPTNFFVDWIAETSEITCDFEHCDLCEHWFDCGVAGCCWYYNPYFIDFNYCASCVGWEECSWDFCGACQNQSECEAVGCYWAGEYCSWIVSECGDELACQFCETQETCEAKNCHWNSISQTCWYEAPVLPSDWASYYSQHGGYTTSAVFVNDLADTSGKIFATISSMFEGFVISFNTGDALARGSALGNVIPKARGYLKIFDSLLGHIPIGETFVFILIFMLAIGLFRIARHLIQLVKP